MRPLYLVGYSLAFATSFLRTHEFFDYSCSLPANRRVTRNPVHMHDAISGASVISACDLPGQGLDLRLGQRGKIGYLRRLDSRSNIGVMLL